LRREPDEIAEHDRDDLALAALRLPRHGVRAYDLAPE
jgi:hypothetical protein